MPRKTLGDSCTASQWGDGITWAWRATIIWIRRHSNRLYTHHIGITVAGAARYDALHRAGLVVIGQGRRPTAVVHIVLQGRTRRARSTAGRRDAAAGYHIVAASTVDDAHIVGGATEGGAGGTGRRVGGLAHGVTHTIRRRIAATRIHRNGRCGVRWSGR